MTQFIWLVDLWHGVIKLLLRCFGGQDASLFTSVPHDCSTHHNQLLGLLLGQQPCLRSSWQWHFRLPSAGTRGKLFQTVCVVNLELDHYSSNVSSSYIQKTKGLHLDERKFSFPLTSCVLIAVPVLWWSPHQTQRGDWRQRRAAHHQKEGRLNQPIDPRAPDSLEFSCTRPVCTIVYLHHKRCRADGHGTTLLRSNSGCAS